MGESAEIRKQWPPVLDDPLAGLGGVRGLLIHPGRPILLRREHQTFLKPLVKIVALSSRLIPALLRYFRWTGKTTREHPRPGCPGHSTRFIRER